MNNLIDYFKNLDNLSHAFLIGNVVFDEIESDLKSIIKEKILKVDNVNLRENPDIYYYDQEQKLITKDEIKDLLNNLSKTSQFNNAKIYIINGSEKISDVVANTILKTLEEPEENIYAFLITRNIDAVKDTIKSRCQKILINADDNEIFDEKDELIANNLIKRIEENNIKTIALNPEIYNEIDERDTFKRILKIILNKYNYALKMLLAGDKNNKEYSEILKNNDIISLSKKILVINDFQELIENYLNKNLIIDRFIIEMWRCNK